MLAAALSFHSLMEGLTLGVSQRSRRQFLALLVAILAHKFFAAFALGISLSSAASTPAGRRAALHAAVVFALTTPVGAAAGLCVSSALLPRAATAVCAGLGAVSAGIFVYIALVELVAEDFRCDETPEACLVGPGGDRDDVLLRTGIFVAAAVAMAALALVI
jgi:solute carrier family 39 (zinc transporter), member 1/2/3